MSRKYRVGILGATGTVGQRFVQLLENHPPFSFCAANCPTQADLIKRSTIR